EYLYFDLGSTTITTTVGGVDTWNLDTSGSMGRAGLNYRFGSLYGYPALRQAATPAANRPALSCRSPLTAARDETLPRPPSLSMFAALSVRTKTYRSSRSIVWPPQRGTCGGSGELIGRSAALKPGHFRSIGCAPARV